jgi:hypothetical protein
VKSSLVVPVVRHDDEEKPYYTAEYDFVLCGAAL